MLLRNVCFIFENCAPLEMENNRKKFYQFTKVGKSYNCAECMNFEMFSKNPNDQLICRGSICNGLVGVKFRGSSSDTS